MTPPTEEMRCHDPANDPYEIDPREQTGGAVTAMLTVMSVVVVVVVMLACWFKS